MKQSLRTHLPKISEMKKFSNFVKKNKSEQKYIAHCKQDSQKEKIKNPKSINSCILIGPEGDFSKEEIKLANSLGFKSITLSTNRLRTETAAIVACYKLI